MKIITLNVWGGRVKKELIDFLEARKDTDVFCFQEVYHEAHDKDKIWNNGTDLNILASLKEVLPDHTSLYHPHLGDWWGLAMFVKKGIKILEQGEKFVHESKAPLDMQLLGHMGKNIQYSKLEVNGKIVTIVNFHGLWTGKGKDDTEDRILQSKNIVEFLKTRDEPIVLCGDFNLLPTTESLKIIEKFGLRNLITEYGITSTRTSYYSKSNKFADYVFVSPNILINNFEVLPEEVSDHAAILLEIE